jgi:hypothetical protein
MGGEGGVIWLRLFYAHFNRYFSVLSISAQSPFVGESERTAPDPDESGNRPLTAVNIRHKMSQYGILPKRSKAYHAQQSATYNESKRFMRHEKEIFRQHGKGKNGH